MLSVPGVIDEKVSSAEKFKFPNSRQYFNNYKVRKIKLVSKKIVSDKYTERTKISSKEASANLPLISPGSTLAL